MHNSEVMDIIRAECKTYAQSSIQRGAFVQQLDVWIPGIYSRNNLTQDDVTIGAILQCFAFELSEVTGWQFDDADGEMAPWHLSRWVCPHSRVMILARIDLIGRTWTAYCFPVPGIDHEKESGLWRTEGVPIDPKHAAALFSVPWVKYRY